MHVRITDYKEKLKFLSLITKRSDSPILKNIHLFTEGGFLYGEATDNTNKIKVQFSSRVMEEGECLIDPELITIQGEVLEIHGNPQSVTIETGGSTLENSTMLVEQYPQIDETTSPFSEEIKDLNLYIGKALGVLGDDSQGEKFTYITVLLDKSGALVSSCDGLNIYQVFIEDVKFDPPVKLHIDSIAGKLLSSKFLKGFRIALDSFVHFATQDITITTLKEGISPNIPRMGKDVVLFSNPERSIVESLVASSKITDVVTIRSENDKVVIEGSSPSTSFNNRVSATIFADFNIQVNAANLVRGIKICGLTDFSYFMFGNNPALRVGSEHEGYYTSIYKG